MKLLTNRFLVVKCFFKRIFVAQRLEQVIWASQLKFSVLQQQQLHIYCNESQNSNEDEDVLLPHIKDLWVQEAMDWTALPVSLRVRERWWNYLETDFLLLFKCDYKATPRFKLVFWLQDPPKSIANWIIFSVACVVCCFVFNELWVFGQGLRFLLLDRYGVSSMVGMPHQHATQKTDMHNSKFISPCTQYQQKPLQGK